MVCKHHKWPVGAEGSNLCVSADVFVRHSLIILFQIAFLQRLPLVLDFSPLLSRRLVGLFVLDLIDGNAVELETHDAHLEYPLALINLLFIVVHVNVKDTEVTFLDSSVDGQIKFRSVSVPDAQLLVVITAAGYVVTLVNFIFLIVQDVKPIKVSQLDLLVVAFNFNIAFFLLREVLEDELFVLVSVEDLPAVGADADQLLVVLGQIVAVAEDLDVRQGCERLVYSLHVVHLFTVKLPLELLS